MAGQKITEAINRPKVLAVASEGGHFNQLMMLRPGLEKSGNVSYMTTLEGLADQFGAHPSKIIPDCNARTPLKAASCFLVCGWHLIRQRPNFIVTTGALPGIIVLLWGRLLGAQTLWIDSIANAEELSASGRLARKVAHQTLSQWAHVATAEGVGHEGSVL